MAGSSSGNARGERIKENDENKDPNGWPRRTNILNITLEEDLIKIQMLNESISVIMDKLADIVNRRCPLMTSQKMFEVLFYLINVATGNFERDDTTSSDEESIETADDDEDDDDDDDDDYDDDDDDDESDAGSDDESGASDADESDASDDVSSIVKPFAKLNIDVAKQPIILEEQNDYTSNLSCAHPNHSLEILSHEVHDENVRYSNDIEPEESVGDSNEYDYDFGVSVFVIDEENEINDSEEEEIMIPQPYDCQVVIELNNESYHEDETKKPADVLEMPSEDELESLDQNQVEDLETEEEGDDKSESSEDEEGTDISGSYNEKENTENTYEGKGEESYDSEEN